MSNQKDAKTDYPLMKELDAHISGAARIAETLARKGYKIEFTCGEEVEIGNPVPIPTVSVTVFQEITICSKDSN